MSKGKVLMAMSGGIDSSIAAILLHQSGYEVIGITMKTWDYATSGSTKKETGCCNLDTINDARAVAVKLGFPHYILDLKEEFNNSIVKNFISECAKNGIATTATVVSGYKHYNVDLSACKEIAESLGAKFKIREWLEEGYQ